MLLKILLLLLIIYLLRYLTAGIFSSKKNKDLQDKPSNDNIIDVEYEDIE